MKSTVRRTRRLGGVGCFGQIALLMIIGLLFVCAVDFVFAPWSFYLGGRMHVLPFWQGIGRMRTSAGDYTLYLWFAPTPGGRTLHLPSVDGWGYLCTPRGDRFVLRATGSFLTQTGKDTDGKEMHLSLRQRPWNASLIGRYDGRPRLELRGRWRNPNLELDDGGSLSQAFLVDGTLFSGPARNRPDAREHVALVLQETVWSGWMTDCRPRTWKTGRTNEEPDARSHVGLEITAGSDLLSHTVSHAVPSAVAGLTSVFGMGTGVTLLL